jgi:hypothetical protein
VRRALSRRTEDRFPTTTAYVDALEDVVRRRRLLVKPSALVEFLHGLQLLKASSRSGEHAIELPPIGPPEAGPAIHAPPLSPRDLRATARELPPNRPASASRLVAEAAASAADSQPPTEPAAASGSLPAASSISNSGALVLGELPVYLFDLVERRATGKLTVVLGERERHAYFVQGVPELNTSNDEKELLGAFLVARGSALPMEIEMALAVAPRYGGRLGDALVGLGVMRPIELVRAVLEQTRSRFVALVGCKEGSFIFAEGERTSEEETMREAIDPIELITRGVFKAYSAAELEAILAPSLSHALLPTARAPVAVPSLQLPVSARTALDAILGREPLGQEVRRVVERGLGDRATVLAAVFVGLACGAFTSAAWPLHPRRAAEADKPTFVPQA